MRDREQTEQDFQFSPLLCNGSSRPPPAPRQDRCRHGPPLPRARAHGEGRGPARGHSAARRRRPAAGGPACRLRRRLGQHRPLRRVRGPAAADARARGEAELAESVPGGEETGERELVGDREKKFRSSKSTSSGKKIGNASHAALSSSSSSPRPPPRTLWSPAIVHVEGISRVQLSVSSR